MIKNAVREAVWPTPRLIRAGRALAGIDQATLGKNGKVSRQAVNGVENDENELMDYRRVEVLRKLQTVLEEKYGVEFLKPGKSSGSGVRLRVPD